MRQDSVGKTNNLTRDKQMQIAVFGVGIIGKRIGAFLRKAEVPFVYLDNNEMIQNTKYMGVEIEVPSDYYASNVSSLTVIACALKHQEEIEKQLAGYGLIAGKDYVNHETFKNIVLPQLLYKKRKMNYMGLCQITLTERCTLKCKKCAHGCYAVASSSRDMSLEAAYKSADEFFSHIDLIYEFVLIGGEPLLYQKIGKVISYIGENYRDQIGYFLITTNGTIIPSQEILHLCRKYDAILDISNYSHTLPRLKKKYDELIEVLDRSGVNYYYSNDDRKWMDYGFETIDRKASPEELKKVFYACRTPCHEVRENRLYYCVMARSVSDNLHINAGEDDYLDLDTLEGETGKETLLNFILGKFDKGYLDMCNYCRGAEASSFPIPAAEQMTR